MPAKSARTKRPAKLTPSQDFLLGHPIEPMLATLVGEAFDRKDWFFEIKWDGL